MTKPSKFVQRYWSLFARNQATFFHENVFNDIGYIKEEFEYTMDTELFWRILNSDLRLKHLPKFIGAFRIQKDAKTAGETSIEHIKERKKIYNQPWYESVIPQKILETVARELKLCYILIDMRWGAIEYNLTKLVSR
jgi:GT2 family glycosyltransferase